MATEAPEVAKPVRRGRPPKAKPAAEQEIAAGVEAPTEPPAPAEQPERERMAALEAQVALLIQQNMALAQAINNTNQIAPPETDMGDRLGTHPDDPKRVGKDRLLVSDSPELTVILRRASEGTNGTNTWVIHPALKVQFHDCRAIVDEGLLPLLHKHRCWGAQQGGVFDPMDPRAPRPRPSMPVDVVDGVNTGIRTIADLEPLPGWDRMDVADIVTAIQTHRVHPMDAFTFEARHNGGMRRPDVLQAATAVLVAPASADAGIPIESFSAPMPLTEVQ